jgi:hypothetical protein
MAASFGPIVPNLVGRAMILPASLRRQTFPSGNYSIEQDSGLKYNFAELPQASPDQVATASFWNSTSGG